MEDVIPDLWSDNISVSVLTPIAILRAQSELLRKKTKGLLEAEIETLESNKGQSLRHDFIIIAPAVNKYSHKILSATHNKDLVYPVAVEAECFLDDGEGDRTRHAFSQKNFIQLLSTVLQSSEVESVMESLIARSNENRIKAAAEN